MDISSAGRAATIAIEVTVDGADAASTQLRNLGTTGEASAKRVQDAYKQVAASAMDFARAGANAAQIAQLTGSSMKEAREAAQLYAKTLATTEEDVRGLKAANQELAEAGLLRVKNAAKDVGPVLNSVRASMTSMTASVVQSVPGLAQVVSVLGNFAIGAGPMIAVLAGLGAVAFAYKTMTEASRKAKEEQDKLTKSLEDWYRAERSGIAGQRIRELDAEIAKVKELAEEYRRQQAIAATPVHAMPAGGGLGIQYGAIGAAQTTSDLTVGKAAIKAAQDAINKAIADGIRDRANQYVQDIANLVKYRAATAEELQRIRAIQEDLARQAANAARNSAIPLEQRMQLLEWSHALAEAFKTAAEDAKRAADAFEKQQRTINNLAASLGTLGVQFAKTRTQLFGDEIGRQLMGVQYTLKPAALPGLNIPDASAFNDFFRELDAMQQKAEEAAEKYSRDIANIWRDGIGKIVTDGFKSFHDFFEDVFQLFSNLMRRMQQEGATGGIGYKLLGFGAAGLGGGLAGYGAGSTVGSLTGSGGLKSALLGSFSGAAAGAAAGTAVLPGVGTIVGTVVGEIAGLTGALLGGAKAARERKEAEDQLRQSLASSIDQQKALLGIISPLDLALRQNAATFKELREQTESAYAGLKNQAEREAKLRELDNLERQRAQQIQDEAARAAAEAAKQAADAINEMAAAMAEAAAQAAEALRKLNVESQQNSLLRFFDATGQSDLAYALRQALEIKEAREKGLSDESIALIRQAQEAEKAARENEKAAQAAQQVRDAQREALQIQAQAAQEQIRAAEQILNVTRQAIDSAQQYLAKSPLSSVSPLGPEDRYNEARRQYLALQGAAAGGDVKAYQQLPDAIEAFRRESEAMFGHTSRFREDFNSTQITLAALTDQFGAQASIQEQQLALMKAQLAALQAQLEVQRQTLEATKAIPSRTGEEIVRTWPGPKTPDPNLPPGTGGPVGPGLPRFPVRTSDDLYDILDRLLSETYNNGQKILSVNDGVVRTVNTIGAVGGTQIERLERIRDNTKATSDGISRISPISRGS